MPELDPNTNRFKTGPIRPEASPLGLETDPLRHETDHLIRLETGHLGLKRVLSGMKQAVSLR